MLIVMTGNSSMNPQRKRRYQTFKWLAEACKRYQMPLFIITPRGLSPTGTRCRGWLYQAHNTVLWKPASVPIARAIVYDAMYLRDLSKYRRYYYAVWRSFTAAQVPVFNPLMPAKDVIYKCLQTRTSNTLPLPKTAYTVSSSSVLRMLDKTPQIWFKPIHGSGGRNMLWIQRVANDKYFVQGDRFYNHRLKDVMGRDELQRWLRYGKRRQAYMAQEHIPLIQTKDGHKVDFRITIQRGRTGVWEVIAVTARFGVKGAMVTNFHAGGHVLSCSKPTRSVRAVLKELGLRQEDINLASQTAIQAGKTLQLDYPTLGLLGIDVGQSTSGQQYLYDFNSRPGRDILSNDEIHDSMDTIAGYAQYLTENFKTQF